MIQKLSVAVLVSVLVLGVGRATAQNLDLEQFRSKPAETLVERTPQPRANQAPTVPELPADNASERFPANYRELAERARAQLAAVQSDRDDTGGMLCDVIRGAADRLGKPTPEICQQKEAVQ